MQELFLNVDRRGEMCQLAERSILATPTWLIGLQESIVTDTIALIEE